MKLLIERHTQKKYYNTIELSTFKGQISISNSNILGLRVGSPAEKITAMNIGTLRTLLEKVIYSAIEQGKIDKYGNADVDLYQMQYALLNEGAYVSKEEAKSWCDANCSWL